MEGDQSRAMGGGGGGGSKLMIFMTIVMQILRTEILYNIPTLIC